MGMCIIQSSNNVWQAGRNHKFQIPTPESCGTESEKVARLRAILNDVHEQAAEAERLNSKMGFILKGILVTEIIRETSIGFLDLAASAFASINPAASKVATGGILSVRAVQTAGEYSNGTLDSAEAMERMGGAALGAVNPKSMAGKAVLLKSKMAFDSTFMALKSTADSTTPEQKKTDAKAYMSGIATGQAGFIGDALEAGGETTELAGKTMKGLASVGEMYNAAMRYQSALDASFDGHIERSTAERISVQNQKAMLKNLIESVKTSLSIAVSELETCQMSL